MRVTFYIVLLLTLFWPPLEVESQIFFGDEENSSSDAVIPDKNEKEVNVGDVLDLKPDVFTRNNLGVSPRRGQSCTDPRGRPGTCNYIADTQCSNVLRAIRTLGITRQVRRFLLRAIQSPCGFESFDFTLCCVDPRNNGSPTTTSTTTTRRPINFPTTATSTTTRRTTTTTRRTTTTTTSRPISDSECGVQDVLRIVNGDLAERGAWPWAAIVGVPFGSNGISVICGGTLINEDHILTAAHCFDGNTRPSVVRLGDLDISKTTEANHQDIRISRTIIHPSYSRRTLKNDIAIVKLQTPVTFRSGIRPACLPDKYRGFPLQSLRLKPTIIGWGSTGNDRPTETQLRQATVPLEDVKNCDTKYESVSGVTIGNTQICAGFGSTDTCKGDSGGPMLSTELDNGKWAVIGITSFGVKCADSRFPGVYTRVDQYLDWIENNTK